MSTSTCHVKNSVRLPAVAGQFYSDDAVALRREIALRLGHSQNGRSGAKAIIVPHAGYAFSGAVAASAYRCFMADRDLIKRVVLVGPSHRVRFSGIAGSCAQAFLTPLGPVTVSAKGTDALRSQPHFSIVDVAHVYEHSLEVQLPFLQVALNEFEIVPLLTGDVLDDEVAAVMDSLWDDAETRFVISSDLSHYHDYRTAHHIDRATARAIESLNLDAIGVGQACGSPGIRGLLLAAQRHDLFCQTLELRNSGDTAGLHNSVVGYGAFAFFPR